MYIQTAYGGSQGLAEEIHDTEHDLIRLAVNGDTTAFRELYDGNVSRVYALSLRITTNTVLAEELTQEVFVKAWEKLKTFGFQSRFSTWLHSITMNTFLMMKRSEKKVSEKTREFGEYISSDYAINHSKPDVNIDLEKAISELPERMRITLVLHDIEGYKHREISEMLGIETGTSKAQLHKARKILRQKLSI